MKLYLLRHAIAVAREQGDRYPGDDRPLTGRGVRRMERNAAGLTSLELDIGRILHSPLQRSRDTAAIVAEALGARRAPAQTDALLPDADPESIVREVFRTAGPDGVLLVGHEPHLGRLAGLLLGADSAPLVFRKGGIARIDAAAPEPGAGRLVWLLTPRQLRLLAGLA